MNHVWKYHFHNPMGELNGVKGPTQTFKCENCDVVAMMFDNGQKPPNEVCTENKVPLKK